MTINPASLDSFVASLVAQYDVKPTVTRTITVDATPQLLVKKPSKNNKLQTKRAEKAAREAQQVESVPQGNRPLITSAPLPEKGSLDARSYFIAMRRAVNRDERINAIAGFAGFDRHGEYASQELAANILARQTLRPLPANPPVRSVLPTMAGYVAGMPNNEATRIADLQARERITAENYSTHYLNANNERSVMNAALEAERLANIQNDLDRLS